jgi:hypothetical protein
MNLMQINIPKTKGAFEILKARWPEVTIIIGIGVLAQFINMSYLIWHRTGTLTSTIRTLGYFLFIIIAFLLNIGFRRTFYLEGQRRQSPVVLLQEGRNFFWRLFILGLIYWFALILLNWLISWTVKQFASTDESTIIVYLLSQWSLNLFRLLLMKPILLIFPLIIVLDCSILQGFKMFSRCRLRDAKELIVLFLISTIGPTLLWKILPSAVIQSGRHYIVLLSAAHTIIWQFISLMIAVMAVRFVASQNVVYDNGSKPLDSQDSLKP